MRTFTTIQELGEYIADTKQIVVKREGYLTTLSENEEVLCTFDNEYFKESEADICKDKIRVI